MRTTRSAVVWAVVGVVTAGCSAGSGSSGAASPSQVGALPTQASSAVTTTAVATPGAPTPTPAPAPTATSTAAPVTPSPTAPSPTAPESGLLRPGAEGAQVLAVQQRLSELGYWLGTPDGVYGAATVHAVTALQKAAGLGRDGVLGPKSRAALDRGVRPQVRSSSGHVVEIDLARQLLSVVDDGRLSLVLDTSTGSGAWYTAPDGHRAHATTPVGTFSVQWSIDGWDTSPLGHLYRPRYFHSRGIAVHGYTSVPPFPASHGCVRVTMAAMDLIWGRGLMPKGGTVMVY